MGLRDDITRAAHEAIRKTGDYLEQCFVEELSDPKWAWPTAPSPRDIVDSGRLRASMQRVSRPGSEVFSWPVEYAAQVHEGAVMTNGRSLPARPWTREPLKEAEGVFSEILENELRSKK